jgi:hypothetical protein
VLVSAVQLVVVAPAQDQLVALAAVDAVIAAGADQHFEAALVVIAADRVIQGRADGQAEAGDVDLEDPGRVFAGVGAAVLDGLAGRRRV